MSDLSRWKEYRIRQAIYLESLRQQHTPPTQSGFNGGDAEMRRASSEVSLEDTHGVRVNRRMLNRTKNDQLSAIVLRYGLLVGSVAIWLLLWWVEFGIHR
jgi:hypothetical protein